MTTIRAIIERFLTATLGDPGNKLLRVWTFCFFAVWFLKTAFFEIKEKSAKCRVIDTTHMWLKNINTNCPSATLVLNPQAADVDFHFDLNYSQRLNHTRLIIFAMTFALVPHLLWSFRWQNFEGFVSHYISAADRTRRILRASSTIRMIGIVRNRERRNVRFDSVKIEFLACKLVYIFYSFEIYKEMFLFVGKKDFFWGLTILKNWMYGLTWEQTEWFPRKLYCPTTIRSVEHGLLTKVMACSYEANRIHEIFSMFMWFWTVMLMIMVTVNSLIVVSRLTKTSFVLDLMKCWGSPDDARMTRHKLKFVKTLTSEERLALVYLYNENRTFACRLVLEMFLFESRENI